MNTKTNNRLGTYVTSLSKRFTGVLLLVLSIFLGFVMMATGPRAEPLEKTERAWPVSVITAEPGRMSPTLLTYGKVESKQVANLNTTISAPVSEVLAREGAWVEEGELLIQLDAREIELALNVAQANYDQTRAIIASIETEFELANSLTTQYQELKQIGDSKLSRALDLNGREMISDAQLDQARQEANNANIILQQHLATVANFPNRLAQQRAAAAEAAAYLERANLDLAQTRIRAPFSGRVISSEVSRGDRVIAGATLIQIADYDNLEIRASVPSDVAYQLSQSLRHNQQVSATANLDGKSILFRLDRISADIKPGQSGIDVFFRSEAGDALDIGRVVSLAVKMQEQEGVISMPLHALYENQTIYRIEEQRLRAINYETVGDSLIDGEFRVLIRAEDIRAGDQLLGSQLSRAITGLLVEPLTSQL